MHFLGLLGPNGPLPLHLTDYARERLRNHDDPTFARFLDLFNHRMLGLFYRAWAQAQPTVSFDRPEQHRFGMYLGALQGTGTPGCVERDDMSDLLRLHFTGHLGCQTKHAEGLRSLLASFLQRPIQIQEFVGHWLTLPEDCHWRLGESVDNSALGQTTTIGGRVWDQQCKFRVRIGPLPLADYLRLLPGGDNLNAVRAIVRNYVGDQLAWDLNLVLAQPEIPQTSLGHAGRLGWTTWLQSTPLGRDGDDLKLDPSPKARINRPSAAADSNPNRTERRSHPMTEISRSALFGKLNPLAYKAIEGATLFCKMRGNPYVELVHWLHQILQNQDTDLHRIMQRFDLDAARLAKDLTDALERLPRGSRSIADLSSDVEEAVERGWVYGTLMFGETQVRTGHLMVGILKTRGLRSVLLAISRQFDKIGVERLSEEFAELLDASPEAGMTANDGFRMDAGAASGDTADAIAPAQMGKQDALKQFSIDLTERARNGELDPIVGRDQEIRQIVDILMRRRQNNPILTGEAGVGKTAVVEGFALRIAAGEVPPPLADVTLRVLDIGLLQAGASMKGEFEHRLRQVIDEVQTSPEPIILFIDEAHTLIGAGGTAGTGDAANLLKPALARGTLRTLAATTWSEYKKYIEKDPALTRRFQVIQIHEPSEDKAILMLRGIASTLEQHHRVATAR